MVNSAGHIQVRGLSTWYGKDQVLKDLTIDFKPNSVTAVTGENGSGKSTFLNCCNRMLELTPGVRIVGSVLLDGTDIYGPKSQPTLVRRAVGTVFQSSTPFAKMTIYQNVVAGLALRQVGLPGNRPDYNATVEQVLKSVGLWEDVKRRLHQSGANLSGGQKQRLCIARSIATGPSVLLMDEPFSALDDESREQLEMLIRQLAETLTIIFITHDKKQAKRVADEVLVMKKGKLSLKKE